MISLKQTKRETSRLWFSVASHSRGD